MAKYYRENLDVKIIGIDEEKKRVSLSIRALLDPKAADEEEVLAEVAAPADETPVEETPVAEAPVEAPAEETVEAPAEETAE